MQTAAQLLCTLVSTHEGQMTCLPFFPFLVDFSLADPSTVHSSSTSNRASLPHAITTPANRDNVISHHIESHSWISSIVPPSPLHTPEHTIHTMTNIGLPNHIRLHLIHEASVRKCVLFLLSLLLLLFSEPFCAKHTAI